MPQRRCSYCVAMILPGAVMCRLCGGAGIIVPPEPKPPTNQSNAVFHIPDTDEGKEFIRLARKYMNNPTFKFKRQGNNRAGWSAMYIYRHWEQEPDTKTCPKCDGKYFTTERTKDWWIERTCRHCDKGIKRFLKWVKIPRSRMV